MLLGKYKTSDLPVRIAHDDAHALPGACEVQYSQHLVPLVHETVTARPDAASRRKKEKKTFNANRTEKTQPRVAHF